jgi:hypothetical protein
MNRWLLFTALFAAAGIAFILAVNADQGDVDNLFPVLACAALALGWGTGEAGRRGIVIWLLLPWIILIPLAVPFGDANKFTGGDDTGPVTLLMIAPALFSMVLILIGVGARSLYEGRRRRHISTVA